MGYPLNNYSVLGALASMSNKDNVETKNSWPFPGSEIDFMNSLRKFNLFGFIIHDPKEHSGFDKYLNSIFNVLDHSTGNHFLFFALVSPTEEWIKKHSGRKHSRNISKLEKDLESISDQIIRTNNPSEAAYVVAHSLKIPLNDLPVLVVTNDLFQENYRWYKTGTNHIANQLIWLGYLATDILGKNSSWEETEKILINNHDVLNPLLTSDSGSLIEGLVCTLSDILSLIYVSNKNANNWESCPALLNQAKLQASSSIVKLTETIKELKAQSIADEIFDEELFDHLNLKLVEFLSLLNQRSSITLNVPLNISDQFLENESFHMLTTALKVLDLFKERNNRTEEILGSNFVYDYSAVGICLTKLFEKEISLSIVHWIRKMLDVDLPKYFDKVDPNVKGTYKPDNLGPKYTQSINFNKEKDSKWTPPAIGQSGICFNSIRMKPELFKDFNYIDRTYIDNFIQKWNDLTDVRNDLAHVEIKGYSDIRGIIDLLNAINELGIFESMYRMKQEFRYGLQPTT